MSRRTQDDAATLLHELQSRGVEVRIDGDRVWFRPRGQVTAELHESMKAVKAELLVS